MPDPSVPCQLEFFGYQDFSSPEETSLVEGTHDSAGRKCALPPSARVQRSNESSGTPKAGKGIYSEVELTRQASNLFARAGLANVADKVSVHWNPKMRTAAGRAFYESYRVELNPGLLKLEGIDVAGEVDRTLRHELAHLIAYHRARAIGRRISPHGREWRQACAELGIPDESRCHTLPFKPRQVRKNLIYSCPTCENEIPRVRKFRQPVACYDCCKKHSGGRYDQRFRLVARKVGATI